MARHVEWEITIPLASVSAKQAAAGQREDYYNAVHDAYLTQYLENLGVEPTERYKRIVSRSAPMEQCDIEAVWGDEGSGVCSQLRLWRGAPGSGARAPSRAPAAVGLGAVGFASAHPPEVPTAATAVRTADAGEAPLGKAPLNAHRERMRVHELKASEAAELGLVAELEALRQKASRGAQDDPGQADDGRGALRRWGEEGMRELEALKSRFILPFAAERPVHGTRGTAIVPWQSPDLRTATIRVPPEHEAELSEPIRATLEDIAAEAAEYAERRLPLELLTCRREPWLFAAVREQLSTPEMARMIGLLAHLLYWTVFGHLRPASKRLPQPSQQSLILTLQELWTRLCDIGQWGHAADTQASRLTPQQQRLLSRDSPTGACFVLPVCVLSLKCNVETVFRKQYAKAFGDVHVGAALLDDVVERLNVLVMNIFDPDCTYASFGALDSSADAIRLWRKVGVLQMKLGLTPAGKMIGKEFRTTPMTLLLMHGDGGEPSDPRTRRLLQRSASDAVLAAVSASPPPLASSMRGAGLGLKSPPRLDERRRRALHRTACKKMSAAGLEVISSRCNSRTTTCSG